MNNSKESALQKKCVDYLKKKGIYYINLYGSGRSAKGAPDLLTCIKGQFVAFELKTGNNELRPDQTIHKNRIIESGGVHYTPKTIKEFKDVLKFYRL